MNYTTLVPCMQGNMPPMHNMHPSQMNLTHNTNMTHDSAEYHSDHSTNHSYITRDSFPISNGDVCEVWLTKKRAFFDKKTPNRRKKFVH